MPFSAFDSVGWIIGHLRVECVRRKDHFQMAAYLVALLPHDEVADLVGHCRLQQCGCTAYPITGR